MYGNIDIPGLIFDSKVGEGGMAEVWLAWDSVRQRFVAVKMLKTEFCDEAEYVLNFRAEEKLLEEIHHQGVVSAYDFNFHNRRWYMIMEYIDGYSFSSYLKNKGPLNESDCLLICESVSAALDYAWNDHGLVHCDINPANIMINSDGIVKLTDLGISYRFKNYGKRKLPISDVILGTPAYISPEQISGNIELDCRADIYCLGATLYHLATGQLLFSGLDTDAMMSAHSEANGQAPDPRRFNPKLSLGFCQLLEAMLVKNRGQRLSSWSDVSSMCKLIESGSSFAPRSKKSPSSLALD